MLVYRRVTFAPPKKEHHATDHIRKDLFFAAHFETKLPFRNLQIIPPCQLRRGTLK